jgi:UDP-N-acetylmuramate: L-alanyl-gamma-D-glutamyl-meso-diaminopimelate ligase
MHHGNILGQVHWDMTGNHSVSNGLMALIAARNVGVQPHHAIEALSEFGGVKRRMEKVGEVRGVTIYDDFAHHPTAIQTTLAGLRARVGDKHVLAIIEPRSNTMRLGSHRSELAHSATQADQVIWYQPQGLDWSLDDVIEGHEATMHVASTVEAIIETVAQQMQAGAYNNGAHIVVMSNGGFEGIHQRLLARLQEVGHE